MMEDEKMKKKVCFALAAAALTVAMSGIPAHAEDKLTVWTWDPSFNIYSMKEAEKIYQKDHPDFSLDIVEVSWDDTQTKLGTILSSGNYAELPDILLMQDFAFQKYVLTFPDLFVELTDSGIDFSQFAEGKVGASVVDGKTMVFLLIMALILQLIVQIFLSRQVTRQKI